MMIGMLLIFVFGTTLGWGPIVGEGLIALILPSITVGLFFAGGMARLTRSSLVDVLNQDYIRTAKSKGLSNRSIIFSHVLKNSLIPVITILAVNISWLISGAVIIEYVFSIPGLGTLLIRAISYRDYTVIQGLCIIFSIMVVSVNLLADLCYMFINPRVLK